MKSIRIPSAEREAGVFPHFRLARAGATGRKGSPVRKPLPERADEHHKRHNALRRQVQKISDDDQRV
jgi:hypothetical protein